MLINQAAQTAQTPNPLVVILIASGAASIFFALEYIRFRLKLRAFKRRMVEQPGPLPPEALAELEEIKRYEAEQLNSDKKHTINNAYWEQLRAAHDKWEQEETAYNRASYDRLRANQDKWADENKWKS